MSIQRLLYTIFLLLIFISVSQAQIDEHQHDHHAEDHHTHQDSAYHCGMCDSHLFDAQASTNIDGDELHYHGIGTVGSTSAFHCAACESHLGYHNHEDGSFQVLNENISKKDGDKYFCAACQFPLFDQEALGSKNDLYTFFKEPIATDRLNIKPVDRFYKIEDSNITCGNCKGRIGNVTSNDSGGFGMRLKLSKLKKQKKIF